MNFRAFIERTQQAEENKDIQKMLAKLPPSHAALVKGFKWQFHGGNTLDGDSQHVGYMDDQEKEIAVAAPWHYGREFTFLHEIAHRVYEKLPAQLKQQWAVISQQLTPEQRKEKAVNQSPEELFCHSYACFYSKHQLTTYNNPLWMKFIQQLS